MRKKIFRSLLLVSVLMLLLCTLISTAYLHNSFNQELESHLSIELELASDAVEGMDIDYLKGINDETYRFTVVEQDGTVIYDTKVEASTLSNHADREEIREALNHGKGSSARYSSTLTEKTYYEAVRLSDGRVLRVSVSRMTVGGAFIKVLPMFLLIVIIAIIVSFFVSHSMAKHITAPLYALDLDHPTENDTYEELSPVLTKIRHQHNQIKTQMNALKQKTEELEQIISSMNEGLIILNAKGAVVAMNQAAKDIFLVHDDPKGKQFLQLERSPEMSNTILEALEAGHAELLQHKNGREYQFTVSRILSQGEEVGVLILSFDITEKAYAERNRQEFTANVSHELKTPLQTIIGSAELLENGLVKPGDTSRFIGIIKKEATRLVNLINDIIRLSQLDEKAEATMESVDMKAIANEVVEVLTPSAQSKNVTLHLHCGNLQTIGVCRYLYEILYNLCDNAIRYNKDGGKINITLDKQGKGTVITVSDTGIGIPAAHQARIFERFYRVDKSHSKQTGGTGLGLSIVKRAVMLHSGKVELNSTPGIGTTIKVILPQ